MQTFSVPSEQLRASESLVVSAQAGRPSFVHVWDSGSMGRLAKPLEIDAHVWRVAFAGMVAPSAGSVHLRTLEQFSQLCGSHVKSCLGQAMIDCLWW